MPEQDASLSRRSVGPISAGLKLLLRVSRDVALCALAAFVAADLALELFLPGPKLGEFLANGIQAALDRQVRVGKARVGLWNGLRLERVSVSEVGGFQAGTFLEADRLSLIPRFRALAAGKIELAEVVLDRPRIKIVRDRTGRFNFSDFAPAFSGGSPAPPPASRPEAGRRENILLRAVSIRLGEVRIHGGAANFIDRAEGWNLLISDLEFRLSHVSSHGHAVLKADFKAEGVHRGGRVRADAAVDAKARLDDFYPVSSAGRVVLSGIRHSNLVADRVQLEWDLALRSRGEPIFHGKEGPSPADEILTDAEGTVRLRGSPGEILDLEGLRKSEGPLAAKLLYPLEILTRLRGLGLSEMPRVTYDELRGDCLLKSGTLNFAPFYLRGPVISLEAEGVVNLKRRTAGLKANLAVGKTALGVLVSGPLENPSVKAGLSLSGPGKKFKTIRQEAVP